MYDRERERKGGEGEGGRETGKREKGGVRAKEMEGGKERVHVHVCVY